MYSPDDYNYELPEELIAQVPAPSRDESRLMVLERRSRKISHHQFSDITRLLNTGDILVVNNTRVVPGRLTGTKETGGRVEVLLLDYPEQTSESKNGGRLTCQCLVKASKPSRPGSRFHFSGDLHAIVMDGGDGLYKMQFHFKEGFDSLIHRIGQIPLPPYIERKETAPPPCDDRARYQTVYAREKGAVAAPTAGLHFSGELLKRLQEMRVEIVPITLHVGYGTFLPIRVSDIRKHQMHRRGNNRCSGSGIRFRPGRPCQGWVRYV
jgi:S-adenosylmethionine:tRNA ribosyltransferase-isomerase